MTTPMPAMILAAGRGERLRPLTDSIPKPLVEVAGRPLIEHILVALAAAGFEDVVINVAHLAERVVAALGEGDRFGLRIVWSREPPGALDTGGGIRRALPLIGRSPRSPFAVINGDIYTDFDFATLRSDLTQNADAHLILVPNPDHHPSGDFGLAGDRVTAEAPRHTFAGIGVYRPELFERVREARFPLSAVLRPAVAAGRVTGALYTGRWYDVGRPQTLSALGESFG